MTQERTSNQEYFDKIKEIKTEGNLPKEIEDQNFFTIAKERSSIRHYDPNFKIERKEVQEILETAILAPSSSNLQPWRFLVIEDQSLKETLLPIANNQNQIVDASVVIAVLADLEAYKKAPEIYQQVVDSGSMTEEIKDFYINQINQHYGNLDEMNAMRVGMIDGGIVAQQLMLTAKAKGYDTVPMGGFDPVKFVDTFNVPKHFTPVMLISLGKAAHAGFPKKRLPLDEVTTWNTF
ncbi:nitroreductase family protein [Longirhabdus pacifica]|uniref:nitroreductase family protein n=1 Tax=Longirhabdus pacifica TaxID=2305227 RepID=UPI001008FC64|nr:nitroreductase family protein [Longirhabdus pacifica]